jgi:outer membrane protein assembly factor BamB
MSVISGRLASCLAAAVLLLGACGGSQQPSPATTRTVLAAATTTVTNDPSAYETAVQQLYVAYFGRPADRAGMAYWTRLLAASDHELHVPTEFDITWMAAAYAGNPTVRAVVDAFGTSAESNRLYGGDNRAAVSAMYRNVLARAPDPAGLDWWVAQLDAGRLTRGMAALSIMASALGNPDPERQSDIVPIRNRTQNAANFTYALQRLAPEAYDDDTAVAIVRAMLAKVDAGTDVTAFLATQINPTLAVLADRVAAPVTALPIATETVTYQVDAAHSGQVRFGTPLRFPAAPAWQVELGRTMAYPLVADGKVFAVSNGPVDGSNFYGGALVAAYDAASGKPSWGPVALPNHGHGVAWSAYHQGKLLVLGDDAIMVALDGATGARAWQADLHRVAQGNETWTFHAAPVAANGIVYVAGDGWGSLVIALDARDGKVLWMQPNGTAGSNGPALSNEGVFTASTCRTSKFDLRTGRVIWINDRNCSGGQGFASVYANGWLFARDVDATFYHQIFDTRSGRQIGAYEGGNWGIPQAPAPAVGRNRAVFLVGSPPECCAYGQGTRLRGVDLATGLTLWEFGGDGQMVLAPLVIDDVVVSASRTGKVYAVSLADGRLLWTGDTGQAIPDLDEFDMEYLPGIGAGAGMLVVSSQNRLTAWRIVD